MIVLLIENETEKKKIKIKKNKKNGEKMLDLRSNKT